MEQEVHYSPSQTVNVIDQVTSSTLHALFNIGLEEETALFETALNDIRTKLFREGTTDELIRKFFKLFVEAIRRLCEATGVEFTEP